MAEAATNPPAGGARRRHLPVRLIALAAAGLLLFVVVNWVYQVVRKPSELLFPVAHTFSKTPAQTWRQYSPIFRQHSTRVISAPLLASLAQVEASGNPLVLTYWRWSWWILRPFEMYRPASSAVGMYQMTDGTFEEARHYCIRDHVAIRDSVQEGGAHSCELTRVYTRLLPGDSVQLTAAYLDVHVNSIVGRLHGRARPTLRQKQALAAVIHLCGAGAAETYARRGFRLSGERCGDHDPRAYVARIEAMRAVFSRLAAQEAAAAAAQ